MNALIIAGIVLGVLAVAGVFAVNMISADPTEEPDTSRCLTCGNSCAPESNCGLANCGAATGGTCGCRG